MVPSTLGTQDQVHSPEKAVPTLAPQGQAHNLVKVGAQDHVRSLEMVLPDLETAAPPQVTVEDDMTATTIK
ncbi:hypothetical protein Tco_1298723 [Tanacetum coccineum]